MVLVNEAYRRKVSFLRKVIGKGDKLFESLVLEKVIASQRLRMVNFLLNPSPAITRDKKSYIQLTKDIL